MIEKFYIRALFHISSVRFGGPAAFPTTSLDSLGWAEAGGSGDASIRTDTTAAGATATDVDGAFAAGFCQIGELLREFHWRALIASTNSVGHFYLTST